MLALLVALIFAASEFIDVVLIEEQLQRIEVFDERLQSALGDRVVDPLTGKVIAFHQRGDGESNLAVVGVWLGQLGDNERSAGGHQSDAGKGQRKTSESRGA